MVIILPKPRRVLLIRVASYGAVLFTLAALAAWAYYKHRATGRKVTPPSVPTEERVVLAGADARRFHAYDQELLAPAAFPWSLAAVSRLPRAEVTAYSFRAATDAETPPELANTLAEELRRQAPALARPFSLPASPPYLVTPANVNLELRMGEDGVVETAAADGAPGELNAAFAETAVRFVFDRTSSGGTLTATVRLVPYCYDRVVARRGGRDLGDEDVAAIFRALQFGTYAFTQAVAAEAPALLTAREPTHVEFGVDKDGRPTDITFNPSLDAAAAEKIVAAFRECHFPRRVSGARIAFLLGV